MNDALRRSAAHVFVDQLDGGHLESDDAHHLVKVLRIRESDVISVSDGRGSWATATLRPDGELGLLEGPHFVPAPTHRLGVAFVPVKGEKPELVVQKLTEIGIDDIYPLAPTAYSVLNAVSCVSATFCLAVGSIGASPMQTLILQWDGTTWVQVPSPNTSSTLANSLLGVSCISPSRCTAVGFHSDGISNLTLALHWDDTSWVQIPTPNPWRGSTPRARRPTRR